MKILVAILLFLAGLVIGYFAGFFSTADRAEPYMETIPRVEEVAGKLETSTDTDEIKRLCDEFKTLVDRLQAQSAPKSIVDAGREDIKKYCEE